MAAAARWAEAGAINSAAVVMQETTDLKIRPVVFTNALDWLCPRVRPPCNIGIAAGFAQW
jgi:hypothetical protein